MNEDGPRPTFSGTERWLLAVGLGLVLVLQVAAIREQSLVGDEVAHLAAGHQALRWGQNRQNLEHPPLLKVVVALPLLLEEPLMESAPTDRGQLLVDRAHLKPEILIRGGVRGRLVALVLVVLPTLLVGSLVTRRFVGPRAAAVWVLLLGLSFPFVPNLSILQTDSSSILATLLTVATATRYLERPNAARASHLGLALGLAVSVKFSGLLLAPVAALAPFLAPGGARRPRRLLAHLLVVGLGSLAVVELSYAIANHDYDSATGRETIVRYCRDRSSMVLGGRLRDLEEPFLKLERLDPRFAQWATGLLSVRAQNAEAPYFSYAFGSLRSHGRWWYFPALVAVKTPLILAAASLAGLLGLARSGPETLRSRLREDPAAARGALLALLAVVLHLCAAMTSNYNLGIRHLFPPLALALVPLASFVSGSRVRTAVVVGLLAVESVVLCPLWMSATNTWWLGARNPTRWSFGAGNLEWGQNLVALRRVAEERGITRLDIRHPAIAPQRLEAWVPGARGHGPDAPLEPGWIAVSVMAEQFAPSLLEAPPGTLHVAADGLRDEARHWLRLLETLGQRAEDAGYVAGTYHLFRVHETSPDSGADVGSAAPATTRLRAEPESTDATSSGERNR